MKYDLVIKNGEMFDGESCQLRRADVAVKNGKIERIDTCIDADGADMIDAAGKVVSAGFIDPHAHDDGYILYDPSDRYKLSQGVTTAVSGNCGEGLFPVSDEYYEETYEYYRQYYPHDDFRTYKTADVFFGKVDSLRLGINQAFHCAHGTLRMYAMGFSDQKANEEQMAVMKAKLREAMEAGALGMSTGLVYSPGCFADTEEIIELCKVVAEYGGIYATHMRSEGYELIKSVREAIEIARKTKVRTVISHLKALGRNYWGYSSEVIKLIEDAQKEGLEVFADQYPYTRSCTILHWVIPIEYTTGGFILMCKKLADPAERQKIKDMFDNRYGEWDNLMENITPTGIHVLKADATPDAVGKTIQEYADERGEDPYDSLFDIIIANKADAIAAFDCMSEDDVRNIMKKNWCMVGSDGIAVMPGQSTHPRLTGTFPRVLGHYAREEGVLSLEQALYKMTALPAKVMKLKGKGLLKEGYDADICVFDRNTVDQAGTFEDFDRPANGIEYVIVNGRVAYAEKKYTGAGSGKRIKRI